MNMKKIDELIEKNVSEEEAKKLLTKEEFEEFKKLMKMKSVLLRMELKPSADLERRVLSRLHDKKRPKSVFYGNRFRLVFAVVVVVVFVGLLISRGSIPPFSPITPAGRMENRSPNRYNVVSPSEENKNSVKMFSPVVFDYSIKITVHSEDGFKKAESVIKEYCPKKNNGDFCEIEASKVDKLVEELKKCGYVELEKNNPTVQKNLGKVTIKLEVIRK